MAAMKTEEFDEFLLGLNDYLNNVLVARGLIEPEDDEDIEDEEEPEPDEDEDIEDDEDDDEEEEDDADEDDETETWITGRTVELKASSKAALTKAAKAVGVDVADLKGKTLSAVVDVIIQAELAAEEQDEDEDEDDEDDLDIEEMLEEDEDEEDEPEPEPTPAKKTATKKSTPAKRVRATAKK